MMPRLLFTLGMIASFISSASATASAQSGAVTAITGVLLIDGTERAPVTNATLLVRDGKVVAAGPGASVSIPTGAQRVALAGKVVIPGLINAHGHVNAPEDLDTYAAYGVTTVFSLGGEPQSVFAKRVAQHATRPKEARVYLAGPVLTPQTPDEARAMVADVAKQEVDIVKIRVDDNLGTTPKMKPEVYRAVIDAAHARGMRVAVHFYYLDDAKALLAAGADFMAHSVRDRPVDDAFVRALASSGKCYSPTLMREVSTFVYGSTPPFFTDSLFLAHANKQWMATLSEPARQDAMRASGSARTYEKQLPVAERNLIALSSAGVPIAMGTDTGPVGRFQGYFELMEMEMMFNAGMSPRQVLMSATRDAAKCMQIDREVGTLEPGKWADFVVLDGSPLERVSNIRRINSVWIAGAPIAR